MFHKIMNKYKKEFKNCLNDLKHKETFYKQIPNLITISRPLGMIPANILFFTGHPGAALILTTLLLSTDFIDGKLARHWKVESKLGADLDAVGDKIIFLGMSLPLIVSNPLFLLNILFEMAIAYINVKGRMDDLDTKTVYSGKIKTCFLSITLLIGYLVQFFNLPLFLFQSLIVTTSVTQCIAFQEYMNKYTEMKQNMKTTSPIKEEIISNDELQQKEGLKEELIKEKEFLLSMKEPDKEKKDKKKVRKK